MPELEFSSNSTSFRVEHGSSISGDTIYVSIRLVVGSKPVIAEEQHTPIDHWGLHISSGAEDFDELDLPDTVGRAKRISKNIASITVSFPPSRFEALSRAILSGARLSSVSIEMVGLSETDEVFIWNCPDDPIDVSSVSLDFSGVPSSATLPQG